MSTDVYQGTELDVFAQAKHWKAYWGGIISRYVGSRVLEVGAGAGATIKKLHNGRHEKWLALEPDARLAERIRNDQVAGVLPGNVEVAVATLADFRSSDIFDTILYIDVLEHIFDDRFELRKASRHLAVSGNLVVLAPAHQRLFSPFDAAIGHFRRYSRRSLLELTPSGLTPRCAMYLDCFGLLASLGNRLVLKASNPTQQQIEFWDNWLVPASQLIDPILGHSLGKSVLVVWQKERSRG